MKNNDNTGESSDKGLVFLETLRKTAEMAQELFNANRDLSLQIKSLEADLVNQQARVAFLERETKQLRSGLTRLAIADDQERTGQFERLLEEQNVLAHLFITSDRLSRVHSAGDGVMAAREVLHNLIGATKFAIWLSWPQSKEFICILNDGMEDQEKAVHLPLAKRTVETKQRQQQDGSKPDEPPIAIPLWLAGEVVGALLVAELVPQRPRIERLHGDLLRLMEERFAASLAYGGVHGEIAERHNLWSSLRSKFSEGQS